MQDTDSTESETAPLWVNWGCGSFLAPKPWVNADIRDDVGADVVIDELSDLNPGAYFEHIDRLYVGHAIEHMDWHGQREVAQFFGHVQLTSASEVCLTAPDVLKIAASGDLGLLRKAMEDDRSYGLNAGGRGPHRWNCYEERLLEGARRWAPSFEWRPVSMNALSHDKRWPVTAYVDWQCCIIGDR